MAKQQQSNTALFSGPYGIEYPKMAMPAKGKSTTQTSKEVKSGDIKLSDVIKFSKSAFDNEINASTRNTELYFQKKAQVEKQEALINAKWAAIGIQYNENPQAFFNDYGESMVNDYTNLIQSKDAVRRFHQLAEKDQAELKDSPIGKAQTGQILTDEFGNNMTAMKVLEAKHSLIESLKAYPDATQAYLGIEKKKRLTPKELNTLSEEDIRAKINERATNPVLRKEDRIAMQDILPLGSGWDDITFTDSAKVMKDIQSYLVKVGNVKIGTNGNVGVESTNKEQITLAIDTWLNDAYTNPENSRWLTEQANDQYRKNLMVLGGALTTNENKVKEDFNYLTDLKKKIGLDSYGMFGYDEARTSQAIADSDNLTEEEKKAAFNFLSDKANTRIALMYGNIAFGNILSKGDIRNMFQGDVRNNLIKMYTESTDVNKQSKEYIATQLTDSMASGDDSKFTDLNPTQKVLPNSGVTVNMTNGGNIVVPNKVWDDVTASIDSGSNIRNIINQEVKNNTSINNKDQHNLKWASINYAGDNSNLIEQNNVNNVTNLDSEALYKSNPELFDNYIEKLKTTKGAEIVYSPQTGNVIGIKEKDSKGRILYKEFNKLLSDKDFRDFAKTYEKGNNIITGDKYARALLDVVKSKKEAIEDPVQIYKNITGGKFNVTRKDLSIYDYKDLAYSGDYNYANEHEYYNFSTGKWNTLPVSAIILDERSYSPDLGLSGTGKKSKGSIAVETYMALTEDQMKKLTFIDKEGQTSTYWDYYGDDAHSFKELSSKDNPNVTRYIQMTLRKYRGMKTYEQVLDENDDRYVVPVYIKRNRKEWTDRSKIKQNIKTYPEDSKESSIESKQSVALKPEVIN